jgi:hypothetical protein
MKTSWHCVKSALLKSQSQGLWRGHNMGNYCTCVSIGKNFKSRLLNNYWARIVQIYINIFWGRAESRFRNHGFGGRAVGAKLGNIIFKFAFKGGIIRKSPQDPLHKKSSNSHKSFLLKCNNEGNYFCRCLLGKNWPIWLRWAMWPLGFLFSKECCLIYLHLSIVLGACCITYQLTNMYMYMCPPTWANPGIFTTVNSITNFFLKRSNDE